MRRRCGLGGRVGRRVKIAQGFANGLSDEATHAGFVAEFHFAFGGVDIDVDGGGIDFEEEAADGVAAFHEGVVVAFDEGEVDASVFDGPAIDEDMLFVACGAGDAGGADESPETNLSDVDGGGFRIIVSGLKAGDEAGLEVDGDQGSVGAMELSEALSEGVVARVGVGARHWGELPEGALVLDEGEADVGVSESGEGEVMLDVGAFGFFAAEEFSAGGEIEEELADFDGGAVVAGGGADVLDFAAVDDDLGAFAGGVVAFAGGEGEAADAGDAGDGFASEAHGLDGGEVFGALDFAGGVAFEREEGVVAAHAPAVVGDSDEASAAGGDFDGDAGGVGVDGVFDEFLDDGGWALDHFTGCDLVGDLLGEELDAVHRG